MKKIAHVISSSGFCSRRKAEQLILDGRVYIDGEKVETCAIRVDDNADIYIDNKKLIKSDMRLFLFHKPVMYLASHKSQNGYNSIFDLINIEEYLTFIGRLDYMSEGLMVLTNVPSLVSKFSSSKYNRIYEVLVDRVMESFIRELENPELDGYKLLPIRLLGVEVLDRCYKIVLELHEGKNREIRRICDKHEMTVLRLKKIQHGPFQLENLKLGELQEVNLQDYI
ncbi:pseudouridine synthase [Candidatus Cytomitobacter primus]|uniref:Dual-specificity RNA pseudouridine synthase RluF n=1 Tax=Candidatus Cytomitobacter primus TaxID=2066024 RepID=A0A5C0UI19_9PROT|nr:pseudouridine synthase [Candidatus Cytomitobacter primus]QEK38594.1 rRNA pseudouridine synthase [Candidatus Cytomitobacter primus]